MDRDWKGVVGVVWVWEDVLVWAGLAGDAVCVGVRGGEEEFGGIFPYLDAFGQGLQGIGEF